MGNLVSDWAEFARTLVDVIAWKLSKNSPIVAGAL